MPVCMRAWVLVSVFAVAPVDAQQSSSGRAQHAHSQRGPVLDLSVRESEGSEPTQLPPIVVTPDENDLRGLRHDPTLMRIQRSLPGLGTDGPRLKTKAEKLTDALGLTGEGVQALHPADQDRLAEFSDRLHGEP